jgi:UbiD family decarboxylase
MDEGGVTGSGQAGAAQGAVLGYFTDFREYLEALDQRGWLRHISQPVDKDRELHPLVRWQYRGVDEQTRFGFLFESVTDRGGRKLTGRVASSVIAAHRNMYALALGCPLDKVHERWRQGLREPMATKTVASGPVKDVIHVGNSLLSDSGLQGLPIPFATNGWEAFPRITAAACLTRDPDTKAINVGMYNSIVLGPTRANLRTSRHLHLHWLKCRDRGVPLQMAMVIGAVPIVPLVSANDVPYGVSELDVAGGIIGESIPVVRCETLDLDVPATAEVIIEGEIPTDFMELDGPSGENRGHVMVDAVVHAFDVKCITHRNNPIWHDLVEGFPPTESSLMRSVNCEGRISGLLAAHGIPYIKDVAFHHCGSARHLCAVSLMAIEGHCVPNGSVWQSLYTIMSVDATWPKIVIAVDSDIDPHNLESVLWAVIDRCQPHRDIKILQGRGSGLDESVAPPEQSKLQRSYPTSSNGPSGASIMLIDATRKWPYPPLSLPRRDYMEHAKELWEKFGLPPLTPRIPWHGESMGHWPEDARRLVELAEQGKDSEAVQLLMSFAGRGK